MTKEASLEAVNSVLSKEVRKLQEELKAADKTNMALTARVEELEIEVEAAKRFGGGFYGEKVQEGTREVYRGFARATITKGERE